MFQVGDLVDVNVSGQMFDGWRVAIVMAAFSGAAHCWFLRPEPALRKYCEHLPAGQHGCWSENHSRIRMAEDPTDEDIAAQTMFLLTGELPQ